MGDHFEAAGAAGQPSSSIIVRFYRDGEMDTLGRTLAQMQGYGDFYMERCHDHMQWMFPLHEPSMFASKFEILTETDIKELQTSPVAISNMIVSLARFSAFLGLPLTAYGPPPQPQRWDAWAHDGNHNLLRVTRAIRSSRLFGLEDEARSLYEAAMTVAQDRRLSRMTVQFWTAAVGEEPMARLQRGGRWS